MLALGEICFEGMGAVEELKRGLKVLARYQMCFQGIGAVEKGVGGVGIG